MTYFTRTDVSLLGRWWWTVDRLTLAAIIALMAIGAAMIFAVSPAAANRIGGLESFQLAQRQIFFLILALGTIFAVSLFSPRWIRRLAFFGFLASLGLLALTLVAGVEIKGASRWLSLGGLSVQPSEFVKPCFAVTIAWMLAAQKSEQGVPGYAIGTGLWLLVVLLLIAQPDLGQAVMVSAIWGIELFVAGLPLFITGLLGLVLLGGVVGAYFFLPHVTDRIDRFLDPSADRYQVERAMEAFSRGGLFGQGPGEGRVKASLPDAHSDFIFAVAGEEMGFIVCLIIVALFAFIVLRGFSRLLQDESLFCLLAVAGLLGQFGLQAMINMASSLHLMPTKGMTLPFISYGGSSVLALALGMGMVLALTRRRAGTGAAL
jgi:cell division protein FtsW